MTAKSILVLDTETTGLDENSRIIEISALDHNGHPLINTLINPGVPIPKDAYAVHGIDDAMVRDAPTWAEVSDSILGLLQQYRLLIYNAPYDLRLLCPSERFATGRELQPTDFDATCVMQLAMDVIDTEGHRISLKRAAEHCGISWEGLTPHRAISDCAVTLDVYRHLVKLPPLATGIHARQHGQVLPPPAKYELNKVDTCLVGNEGMNT